MSYESRWSSWKTFYNKTYVELLWSITTCFMSQLSYYTVMDMGSFLWGEILMVSLLEKVVFDWASFFRFTLRPIGMILVVKTHLTYFTQEELNSPLSEKPLTMVLIIILEPCFSILLEKVAKTSVEWWWVWPMSVLLGVMVEASCTC